MVRISTVPAPRLFDWAADCDANAIPDPLKAPIVEKYAGLSAPPMRYSGFPVGVEDGAGAVDDGEVEADAGELFLVPRPTPRPTPRPIASTKSRASSAKNSPAAIPHILLLGFC